MTCSKLWASGIEISFILTLHVFAAFNKLLKLIWQCEMSWYILMRLIQDWWMISWSNQIAQFWVEHYILCMEEQYICFAFILKIECVTVIFLSIPDFSCVFIFLLCDDCAIENIDSVRTLVVKMWYVAVCSTIPFLSAAFCAKGSIWNVDFTGHMLFHQGMEFKQIRFNFHWK